MKKEPKIAWLRAPIDRRAFLKIGGAATLSAALPTAAAAAQDGVLRIRDYGDTQTMDPAFFRAVPEENIFAAIYRKLVQYEPGAEWGWRLDAAEKIEQVDDTRIAFALREDAGFADGFGAMTAEDVKYSFERVIDPKIESPNKPDWGPLSHVEVTGERTGALVFDEPFAPAWSIALPYAVGNIVSKKAVEQAGGRIGPDPVAVSGPYRRKSWSPKQKTALERNPQWQGAKPDFDEIEVFPIDDETTAEIAFAAGDVDFTRVSLSSLAKLREETPVGGVLRVFPSLFYVWVGINLDNPKLADPRVRRALQTAIDVQSILDAAYFGEAEASTGIIAPGLIGHRTRGKIPPTADFEKAKALLAEAGVEDLSLTLDVLNKNTNIAAAQVIQANLAQIGVDIEVNVHESGAFWTLGDEKAGDLWKSVELIMNRFSMTPDPYYATTWFTSEQIGIWNWERFRNSEFDNLHAAAKGMTDPAARARAYHRMQDLMEESGGYRFITHEATPVLFRDSIAPALRPDGLPLLRYFRKA